MTDPIDPRRSDNAILGPLTGGSPEPTFSGVLSFMRRRYTRALAGVDTVVWGVPFDCATSNRPGTRFGPQAMRRASAIFDGDPQYPSGLDPFADQVVVDWGDCAFDYRRLDDVPLLIERQAGDIIAAGCHLVTLGGDHSITLPLLRAHVATHGPLAVVQFDAHQDTWEDVGTPSHGSFVTAAMEEGLIASDHSVQIGVRTTAPTDAGFEVIDAYEAQALGSAGLIRRVADRVGDHAAYLTFDIDALDPAFAPGTGTPVAGGLSSAQALMTLWGLRMLDWRGMDVVEVSPPFDHADITAIAGCTVVQHYLQILAGRRR